MTVSLLQKDSAHLLVHLPLAPPKAYTTGSSFLMSQTSSQNDKPPSEVAALKRQLAVLEAQNTELHKRPVEEKSTHLHLKGQVIRRLVCLTERIEDLIAEFDRCVTLGIKLDDDAVWMILKRTGVVENDKLSHIYSKLNRGADRARADDMTCLKVIVASWLMQHTLPLSTVIQGQNKMGHGFNNDATGQLIYPVDYDWNDPMDYHPDYHVTAHP
ncbi:hypothetical protein BDR04DRAFT_1155205 [Suillus decipiens]|nr:hypothetical protein BDR04DRAFT_1155205 [Suillus decipiens]